MSTVLRADEAFYVLQVVVLRVFIARAGPQQALRVRVLIGQGLPARAGKNILLYSW
ncbi:MAG: hypothetical protein WKG07_30595 [Hymenobacter sp.]